MTQQTCGRALCALSFACLTTLRFAGGCAPTQFAPAIAYYAEKTAVTDAAARHTTASPYYRFDTALLSDLDDALESSDVAAQRRVAAAVLRGAAALSQASYANEIQRMPAHARAELERLGLSRGRSDQPPSPQDLSGRRAFVRAALREAADIRHTRDKTASSAIAGGSEETAVLQQRFSTLADAALERDLREVDWLPPSQLQRKLRKLRRSIEDLPDDRGRTGRRVLYSWAGIWTAAGIAREEAKLSEKSAAKAKKRFYRIAIWRPGENADNALIARYAPIVGVEWPDNRRYDADDDRIGAVTLSKEGRRIEVHIDSREPTVYAYTSAAKINGERLRQLNYVWWFPERPEMVQDDSAAGHIDGAMIRITLDADDKPLFIESSLNCGCGHEVFVSNAVESAARRVFGPPLAGKRFSVERRLRDKHDVVVIHTFDAGPYAARPLVLSAAGYHEVCRVSFRWTEPVHYMDIVEERSYRILDYDVLDRLPIRDGVASMFGPDGLVHYAGRREGFLLAPSGMLSAGQPRKRGTQRIRWDDFLHDDPHLLEKTLRIPPLD